MKSLMQGTVLRFTGVLSALVLLLAGCELPPMESEQGGYRGTGMAQIYNPESKTMVA